jgi:phage terminase large subunit GpA-like protein
MAGQAIRQMTLIHPDAMKDGQWYFGLLCKGCGKRFAVDEDETRGTRKRATVRLIGDAPIIAQCPFCPHEAEYSPADVIQWCHRVPQTGA